MSISDHDIPRGGPVRLRLAVGLISAAAIAMELALMRTLSERLWHHFAQVVIGVALLGFAASGTVLSLVRARVAADARAWVRRLALAMAVAAPASALLVRRVDLDVQFLGWHFSEAWNVLAMELLLAAPFFLAGGVVGVALTDRPERLAGHYAANLLGSGAGAVIGVAGLTVLSPSAMLVALAWSAWVAGALLVTRRRAVGLLAPLLAALLLAGLSLPASRQPPMSAYKALPQILQAPGAELLARASGPLGRIDVVSAEAAHVAPGLSLQWQEPLPPQVLLIVDGDEVHPVYDVSDRAGWAFTDYTTDAAGWAVRPGRRACILAAGGGEAVGLAVYHGAGEIVAVQTNPQMTEILTTQLARRGGGVFLRPEVRVVNREVRGFLLGGDESFDRIHVPGAVSPAGAGLASARENYLHTVESFAAMIGRLADGGVLSVSVPAEVPARQGLRLFDTAARAVRAGGGDPAGRLAMLRSWTTVTVLVSQRPWSEQQLADLRRFAEARGFDLCHMPGLQAAEANRFHQLERAEYFLAARALLSDGREAFLEDYLFDVSACTDDRPYFFDFLRWRSIPVLRERLGETSRAFLEPGTVMLAAAVVQSAVAAVVLVLLPLLGRAGALRAVGGKPAALAYFGCLGLAFMMLEMGFLQKLILYLADPVFSAAAVIAAFLVFAGVGSLVSGRWSARSTRAPLAAGGAIVLIAAGQLLLMDRWLAATQSLALPWRVGVAAATIAPLALAMGHMFPLGLRRVSARSPQLVPWCWAVNGVASVIAAAGAPLAAMEAGFSRVTVAAIVLYALAALAFRFLAPAGGE